MDDHLDWGALPWIFGSCESPARAEAFRAKKEITIFPLGFFGEKEKLVTRIVQAIHEAAGRPAGVRAFADLHQAFFHAHRHPLIEDETFPLPVLVPEFLLVGENPAVQLKDVLKTFAAQKR